MGLARWCFSGRAWVFIGLLCSPMLAAAANWTFDVFPGSLQDEVMATVAPWRSEADKSLLPNIPGFTFAGDKQSARAVSEPDVRDAITRTLEALGYYDALVILTQDGDQRWHVQVRAGNAVTVARVDIQLSGDMSTDKRFRPPDFPFAVGAVLDQTRYEDYKQQMANRALERGYFDARWVTNDIALDLQSRQATITLHFDSGKRYRFGDVHYVDSDGAPLTALDVYWQKRLIPFKTGDEITSAMLLKFQKALQESRYFSQVSVNLQRLQAQDDLIPVEVRTDTRKPNRVSTGFGYATDVGPRLSLQAQRYLINSAGHSVEFTSNLSQIQQQAELRYKVPWTHPVEDTLQFLLGVQKDRIVDTDTITSVVGVQRVMLPEHAWQQTYGIRVADERYHRDSGERGDQTLVIPSYSVNRTTSRGGLDPVSGSRQFYQIEGADRRLLSDADYVSLRAGWRWLDTYAGRHMLLLRLDAGSIFSSDFSKVPPTTRFYAGGDNSVRGYEYRSLSPRNSLNETVGGQYLVAGSVEYDWRWKPSWRPAVFIDAGNAFNDRWKPLSIGTGVGMRWVSPVGPVSFDVASAVTEPGCPLRIHVTLGTLL